MIIINPRICFIIIFKLGLSLCIVDSEPWVLGLDVDFKIGMGQYQYRYQKYRWYRPWPVSAYRRIGKNVVSAHPYFKRIDFDIHGHIFEFPDTQFVMM